MSVRADLLSAEPGASRSQPAPSGGTDQEGSLERRVKLATSVLAPTTILTGLLFYYGYVATTAEYGYFGITLGTLGLSTQEFLLRSVAALYVPLGVLLLVVLLGLWTHVFVARRVAARTHVRRVRIAAMSVLLLGAVAVVRGIVGVVVPDVSRSEPVALTPMCLGVGIVGVVYGRHVLLTIADRGRTRGHKAWAEQASITVAGGFVVLSLFWAASSFAGAYGRGRAEVVASRLQDRPAVVLDTTDRLFIRYPGIEETTLPATPEQRFRYRYRGLRLLIEANGRMFLLPEQWQRSTGATLVVRSDADVRLQFYR